MTRRIRIADWGGILLSGLRRLGRVTQLSNNILRELLKPPFEWRLMLTQLDQIGVKSVSIATITALFTGMVLALQVGHSLAAYGAKVFIGEIVSLALIRELGPVLSCVLVGGRVGAGITAEIGTMVVTEQVDAVRALATDPIRKLVVPKVAAALLMFPLLTILADAVGIAGGMFISRIEFDIPTGYYIAHVLQAVKFGDIASGVGKTFFFGYLVTLVGCFNGLKTEGGADGVGRATTNTVVGCSIAILISDFFLTKFFILIGG